MGEKEIDVTFFAELFILLSKVFFRDANIEEMKLSKIELLILFMLDASPGMTMTALAKQVGTTNVQISRSVSSLEKNHWVARMHNPENRRVVNVFLTEAGEALFEKRKQHVKQQMQELLARFAPADYQVLLQHLEGIQQIFETYQQEILLPLSETKK